jgi:hypothetical protein
MELQDTDNDLIKRITGLHAGASIGGDPEFFIADKNEKVVASDKFFPGKEKPLCFNGSSSGINNGDCLKLFFDGIQAEMNIGASYCRELITDNIRKCLQRAVRTIEKNGGNYYIVLKPSVKVDKKVILNADPEARRFGCMPDFNAYTRTTNTNEIDATNHPFRYAGGHIHLGISSPYLKKNSKEHKVAKTEEGHLRVIKLLDLVLGIPCLLLDNSPEAIRRRSEYGKAGCFRPTPYGIEYRTPSCWWIKSPTTTSLALGLARLAWTLASAGVDEEIFKVVGYKPEDIRDIHDRSDREEALKVWTKLRPYLTLASSSYTNPLHIKTVRTALVRTKPRSISQVRVAVFSLAVFEYLIKTGLNNLISSNVKKEWHIGSGEFNNYDGFMSGMFIKLCKNIDYLKFQKSFINKMKMA